MCPKLRLLETYSLGYTGLTGSCYCHKFSAVCCAEEQDWFRAASLSEFMPEGNEAGHKMMVNACMFWSAACKASELAVAGGPSDISSDPPEELGFQGILPLCCDAALPFDALRQT